MCAFCQSIDLRSRAVEEVLVSLLHAPSGGVWSVFVLIGVCTRLLGEMAELGCR